MGWTTSKYANLIMNDIVKILWNRDGHAKKDYMYELFKFYFIKTTKLQWS